MADEIISKLGFDVQQALGTLRQLDSQLSASGSAFNAHAQQLNAWNTQAKAVLDTMRQMATAAGKVKLPTTAAIPTGAGATTTGVGGTGAGAWPTADLNTRIKEAIQLTNQYGGAVSVAGDKVRVSGMKGAEALQKTNKQAQSCLMSFSMMSRIVITQAIVRALSQIRNALREATTSAINFQYAIAEIASISTSPFQALQNEAMELSRRFNIPLPDVAEGLYQTISNQFTEVSDRARVMEAAMKLARVTGMELGDSISLLTGTLNAYGMSVSEVEIISAKFFRTIQLGRVRGVELANTLGQVTPVAARLGVELDELLASYVSLTIGALDARKSATGLRQVMMAFLKPSEDMKKAIDELGHSNAEQLLQAEGVIGSLQKVMEVNKGVATEFGKSIRNVRALTAGLSLLRGEGEKYQAAIEAMEAVTADSMDKIYEKFTSIRAERLTSEVNKMKVSLTKDLGDTIVNVLASMIEFVGGADRLSAAIQAIAAAGAVAAAGLFIVAAAFAAVHLAMGPIGLALLAIGAALTSVVGISAYQSAMLIADIRRVAEERHKAATKEIQDLENTLRQRRELVDKALKVETSEWSKRIAIMRLDYRKALGEVEDLSKRGIEWAQATLSAMVSAQERVVSAYRSAAKAATDAVLASRQRQIQAEAAYSDAVFKYAHQNEGAHRKAEAYMTRARILAKQAADALAKAKTPEQITAAQAMFQRADAAAQEAEQIANSTKSSLLQGDAQRVVLSIMQQKITAEQALQRIQAQEAMRLANIAASEKERQDRMKAAMKTILASLELFEKGESKSKEDLENQAQALEGALKDLRKDWLGGKRVDVSELMAFDKLQQRVEMALSGGVSEVRINKLYALPQVYDALREQITEGVGEVKAFLKLVTPKLDKTTQELIRKSTGLEGLDIAQQEMSNAAQLIADQRAMEDSLLTANIILRKARRDMDDAAADVLDTFEKVGAVHWDATSAWSTPTLKKEVDTFITEVERFGQIPEIALDMTDYERLNTAYQAYLKAVKPPRALELSLDEMMRQAELAAGAAEKAAALREGLRVAEPEVQSAEDIRNAVRARLGPVEEAAELMMKAYENALEPVKTGRAEMDKISSIDMSNVISQTGQIATNMWSIAHASQQIKMPTGTEISAHGGRVGRYLAAGGPVGTDVVPSWLSRGEFVMNSGAASKFASQLVAMNAGVQPNFRSDGGSVTNIGDINVTVSGGATGRQTARSIAAELRRELRRGSTTL